MLDGTNSRYLVTDESGNGGPLNAFNGATDNWVLEAIVNPNNPTTLGSALSIGNVSILNIDQGGGVGVFRLQFFGNASPFQDSSQIVAGQDYAIALVANGGTYEFYLDGTLVGSGNNGGNLINPINFVEYGAERGAIEFDGSFDRIRTATFQAGQFNPSTDLINVPEPSSAALLGLGGLALILRRRK